MLRNWQSHMDYQQYILSTLPDFLNVERDRVLRLEGSISKLYLLNLDSVHPVIEKLYSNTGRPAKNQQGIIRSLVLMLDQKVYSISEWASTVASDPLLRAICGFDSDNAPSAASYYDFINRLWLSPLNMSKTRIKKLKPFKSKPRVKLKTGQKQPPKHPGIVAKLVKRAMEDRLPQNRPERVFQELLARCVVDTSADMGILGDVKHFSVAADGTPFYSGGNPRGTKVCDCKSHGIYDCKCPRRYSDLDARWGWDSYREQWYFGNNLFCVVAADSPYDLPVYLRIGQASRHDSVLNVFALPEVRKLYPAIHITEFIADGAMDNYPTYELLHCFGITPIIPLDSNAKAKYSGELPLGVLCLDDKGNPICPGGIPYQNCGYSHPKGIKYRCWFDYRGIDKPCKCTDSPYGRTVYLKPGDDLRLYPPIPRDSKAFRQRYKRRTTAERNNKRLFIDYDIEAYRSRSSRMRFALATMAAINIHLDAWLKHTGFNIIDLLEKRSTAA